ALLGLLLVELLERGLDRVELLAGDALHVGAVRRAGEGEGEDAEQAELDRGRSAHEGEVPPVEELETYLGADRGRRGHGDHDAAGLEARLRAEREWDELRSFDRSE